MSQVPVLSPDVGLVYLAEGAANIVYRIQSLGSDQASLEANTADLQTIMSVDSTSTPPPSELELDAPPRSDLDGRLLRVHKDVPWIASYTSLYHSYQMLILPLFDPEQVISQSLVQLPQSVVTACNEALRSSEATGGRPSNRAGLYISTSDPYGLLIEDMSADSSLDEVLIEIKPKWLVQSPTAPPGSRRCRTCALHASRQAQIAKKGDGPAPLKQSPCPLDLLPDSTCDAVRLESRIRTMLTQKQHGISAAAVEQLATALMYHLHSSPIIRKLRDLQARLDPHGVLAIMNASPSNEFLVATTLRDCTMFIKLRRSGDRVEIISKLGDLDLKEAGTGKLEYWRGIEQELIDGGFYEGHGAATDCKLERGRA